MPAKNNTRILIIGAGSIGNRHLKNLTMLGISELGILDLNKQKLKVLEKEFRAKTFSDLSQALKEKWGAVFIATPPSTHIAIALRVAEKKTPIFIEKPLSHNLQGVKELAGKAKNIKPVMVGYNMDFHPQFRKIKDILTKKTLGKIWGVRAEFGQYLPDWHPKEDYSKGYSARKSLGGGILLDDIHEINLVYNLFGNVKKVFGFLTKVGNLKIDTEDYVELVLNFQNGVVGQIHMDYLQRDYSRSFKIIGEKGTIVWNLKKAKIEIYKAQSKKWEIIEEIKNFDWNTTYLEETREFLRCLKTKKNPSSDLTRGIETLKIALAVKDSSKAGKIINL